MKITKQDALDYHSSGRKGKIEVISSKPCETQRDLSLAYTPGVADPCLEIEKNPDLAYEYTAKGNLVAVISNGTAVLGLGNIGALAGKPVMEGKGVLFKRFADIDVFDIELDTLDPKEVIRTVQLLEPTFGGINLEDIKAPECFYIEEELKRTMKIPVFHDDQHGTAIISGAALLNACEMAKKDLSKIVDRSGLILDIFASHAKTKEAKTQVELAQLQYLLPRLTRAWTHLSKQFGGIGTKGPGETQIETDRRIIRTRISTLKEKLLKIESQKKTQTQQRKDFFRVSLVGYTNAGKSTLFNLVTNAEVLAEDKLFATLDSTTKSFELDKTNKILLSDTVGFIRKLPAHLIASFKSTLNEVDQADLILHVVDLSHPYFKDHIQVVQQTLKELHCESKMQIKVFNKVDLLQDRTGLDELKNAYEHSVIISAERGINISSLLEMIKNSFTDSHVEESIKIKISEAKIISLIHSLAEVLSIKYTQKFVSITYRATKENSNKIRKMIDG